MLRIPKQNRDLRGLVLWNTVLRVLGFTVWISLFYLGAWAYNQNHQTYPPSRLIIGWKLLVWMGAAIVSGFVMFRIRRLFTQRSFSGTIVSYSNSRGYGASDESGVIGTRYDFRIYTVLRVRDEKGLLHRIRFEEKNGFRQYYYEGNKIARFCGLPYPVNTDPSAKSGCVCSACGTFFEKAPELGQCESCGRSLIDPKDFS